MKARGMTLVEVLVALTILALMTVLGWRALAGILAAQAGLAAQLEASRGHQLAFAQLQADCAQRVPSAGFDGRPTLFAGSGRLVLLRRAPEGAGMQVVAYRGAGGALTRAASPATRDLDALHAAWQAALADRDTDRDTDTDMGGGAAATLDAHVAAFELAVWNGGAWQAADGASPVRRQRTRRVVRAPAGDAAGVQVALRTGPHAAPLVRAFLLGAG